MNSSESEASPAYPEEDEKGQQKLEERLPLLDGINTVIACLAVLGNAMVIAVMLLRRRAFGSLTNRLILHQSVIDAVAGAVFFLHKVVKNPTVTVSPRGDLVDELVCRLVYSDVLLWCVNVTSTYNLVVLSLERFAATCHPVWHRNACTPSRLKYALAASWLIGFVYGAHIPLVVEPYRGRCRVMDLGLGVQILIGVLALGTEFVAPLCVLLFAYARILATIRGRMGAVAPAGAGPPEGGRGAGENAGRAPPVLSRAKQNVLATVLTAGVMFVVCWAPTELDYIDELYFDKSWGYLVNVALTGLLACNMFVNPLVYCFMYRKFRGHLADLVLGRCVGGRGRVEDDEPSVISTVRTPGPV